MKNVRSRGGWVLLVLLGGGLGATATAGEAVPIKGRLVGTVTVTPLSTTAPVFRVEYRAAGTVSHLGRVQATLTTPEVELDLLGRRLVVATPEWFGTITAANGDEIFGAYVIPEVVPLTLTGSFSFEAELEILEGTGRFEGATGRAAAVVTGNIFTGTYSVAIDGWIATVGSSKK